MIKYEKEYRNSDLCKRINALESFCLVHGFAEYKGENLFQFIDKLLSRQIDEDNKRFLGYVGEDEKPESYYPKMLTESELSMATDAVSFHARNELRAELRDKVNKNENKN